MQLRFRLRQLLRSYASCSLAGGSYAFDIVCVQVDVLPRLRGAFQVQLMHGQRKFADI